MRCPMLIILLIILFAIPVKSQEQKTQKYPTPESVVKAIFELCTFEGGKQPEWDKIKDLVMERGILILTDGSPGFLTVDWDEFVKLWEQDMDKMIKDKVGYEDKLLRIKTIDYGNIATCYVHFESKLTGVNYPAKVGLNIFSVIKKEGRWWIVSVIEETATPKNPIPEYLFK